MKVKLEGHDLKIDLIALAEDLDATGKRDLARFLVASEQLFAAVLECVSDTSESGFGHYFNDDDMGSWWFDPKTVLELRQKLIPLLPEISKRMVVQAIKERNDAVKDQGRYQDWAWKMYHAWPDGYLKFRPDLPTWIELRAKEAAAT